MPIKVVKHSFRMRKMCIECGSDRRIKFMKELIFDVSYNGKKYYTFVEYCCNELPCNKNY